MCICNNTDDDYDNVSISLVQNKLSSIALTAVHTNISLVSRKSLQRKGCGAKVHWQTVPHKRTSDHKVVCAEHSPGSWDNKASTLSRPEVSSTHLPSVA